MSGRQAKVLSAGILRKVLAIAGRSAQPERNRVIILLSVRVGMRAAEIAGLRWSMVLDAQGRLGPTIDIRDLIAKKGSGRRVPIHPELRSALIKLRNLGGPLDGPIVRSNRGTAMRANSIVNWFVELYAQAGAEGCSSHSGRRTFITLAARQAHRAGASLRDVQLLAGHQSMETTQGYIDGDTDAQRRLVLALTHRR